MMKRAALWGAGTLILLGMGLSGCATSSDFADLRSQVDTISTRLSKVESQSGSQGGASSGGTQMADMESRLDNQKLRIQRLRDRVERINHRLDQLMNQIESQNAISRTAAPTGPTPGNPSETLSQNAPPAVHPSNGVASTAPVVAPLPQKPRESPDALYRQAYMDYQQGHYEIAIKEFGTMVEQFPTSHLASSAVFWQAQSHFNQKQYHRALPLYDKVIHGYPDAPRHKKATAYFKKGQIYEHLNNRKLAKHNYRRVLELFPLDQQIENLAKKRLSRLDE